MVAVSWGRRTYPTSILIQVAARVMTKDAAGQRVKENHTEVARKAEVWQGQGRVKPSELDGPIGADGEDVRGCSE